MHLGHLLLICCPVLFVGSFIRDVRVWGYSLKIDELLRSSLSIGQHPAKINSIIAASRKHVFGINALGTIKNKLGFLNRELSLL